MLDLLDAWLLEIVDPANLEQHLDALVMAQTSETNDAARAAAAERRLEDCDRRLAKFKAALEPTRTRLSRGG